MDERREAMRQVSRTKYSGVVYDESVDGSFCHPLLIFVLYRMFVLFYLVCCSSYCCLVLPTIDPRYGLLQVEVVRVLAGCCSNSTPILSYSTLTARLLCVDISLIHSTDNSTHIQ